MFRLTSERASAHHDDQSGFSLIEVVVAVGLLIVVLVAVLPEMVVGIRATSAAKNSTQAKAALQAQLEVMRSMPYHVGFARNEPVVDLLDTYYRNKVAPTATAVCTVDALVGAREAWSGYVTATGSTSRCAFEPQAGVFYRMVIPVTDTTTPGSGTFTLVLDSVFLKAGTGAPVAPPVYDPVTLEYNSQSERDTPGSDLLGVWATIVYEPSSRMKPVSTYSEFAQRSPLPTGSP